MPTCPDSWSLNSRCTNEATVIAHRWDGHQHLVCPDHLASLLRRLPSTYRDAPWPKDKPATHELDEYQAADQIRRLLDEDDRFEAVSGATAYRFPNPKRHWSSAGYFSFRRNGRLYFVTVDPTGTEE